MLQDVDELGKKFEVKEVKEGYAKNFLFPQDLAKPATKEALLWLETQKEIAASKEEDELKGIQQSASSIEGAEVIITVKVGDKGELFESVTSQKIADKLKEMGFNVKKTQLEPADPIKELGEFPVKIRFDHNLEAEIKVIVNKEEEAEEEI